MKTTFAASVLVAVSATVVWMGTSALAAEGSGQPGRTASAPVARHPAASRCDHDRDADDVHCGGPFKCWTDRDRDDRTGSPSDRDGDETTRCHAHPHTHPHAHARAHAHAVNDGDHDSDDVATPSRHCATDRDRDDRTGRPSDYDGDVCGRG